MAVLSACLVEEGILREMERKGKREGGVGEREIERRRQGEGEITARELVNYRLLWI